MSTGAIRAGRAFVELFADNTRLQQGLRLAEAQVKAFGSRVSEIGRQVATVSLVPAVGGAIGTKIFAGFDDQMRAVQAVTGSTGAEFDQLTEKAKFLGRTTSFTAAQVASGMLELGRAGFKSVEIDAAIAHVMDLARATQTEIPRATEIAGNALRGFGLDADQMGRVSDILATTANNSAQTLDDLGEAFKYVAPVASAAGMSLEDTAKVLGTLANFGIKGSMAGTSVKNILTRMADPAVQKVYENLGVSVKDTEGNLRNMADVLKDVGIATANLPNAEKLAIFKELFDMRALAGGAKLSAESFQSLIDAIDNAAGESSRVAKTMDAGIGGAFRMCLSAAEGVAIAVGETLAPEIQKFTEYLTESQTKITDWINANKETIISVALLSAKLLALGAGLFAFGKIASGVGVMIGIFRSSIVAVRTIVALLTTDISKIGKIFGNLGSLFKPIEPINASVDAKSAGTVQTLGVSAQSAAVSVGQLNTALTTMRAAVANVTQTVASLLTPLSQLLSLLRPVVTVLSNSAKSAGTLAKALNPLAKSLQATSVAAGNLSRNNTALARSFTGMETRVTVNNAALKENQTAAKMAAVSVRSTRTAVMSAAKGYAFYTKAIQENTAAITQNVQAGGVAPNVYFANAAAVKTETVAFVQNEAAQTANSGKTAELATVRTAETATLTADTAALETNTASTAANTAATSAAANTASVHVAAENAEATAEALSATATDASTASTIAEAAATRAATESSVVNAAAQSAEAGSYALSATAADAHAASVIGNTAATEANAVTVAVDTNSLVGNSVSLEGNSAALAQNTAATVANDTALKTLTADSVVAGGVFTKLGAAIKTTFAAKTGGFLAMTNAEAFSKTANTMKSAWLGASASVTNSFAAMKASATGAMSNIASLFKSSAAAVQNFSVASTAATVKTTALTVAQKAQTAIMTVGSGILRGVTATLGLFSKANVTSAASVVKVTTVSLAAKGAVAAYGVASTVCAGAVKGLSAAMALMCAHPVITFLGAITAAVAAFMIATKKAKVEVSELSDAVAQMNDTRSKERESDKKEFDVAVNLSNRDNLSDEQFSQAKDYIEYLQDKYGDLGFNVDEKNKRISTSADTKKNFDSALKEQELNDKERSVKEIEGNLQTLRGEEEAIKKDMESWGGSHGARGKENVARLNEIGNQRVSLMHQKADVERSIRDQKTESVQEAADESPAFKVDEFETRLSGNASQGSHEELAKLQNEYQQASSELQSQIDSAKTPEEKAAAQERYDNLAQLFEKKEAELIAALPETKTQDEFWNKMTENGQSEEEKEIEQLNKDLTAVLEAIKTEISNGLITPEEGAEKQRKATEATDQRVAETRQKYADERKKKLQESALDPYDIALDTAGLNRDSKRTALDAAKRSGNAEQIHRAQTEYNRAELNYQNAERNKNQKNLDTSTAQMHSSLSDYNNAGEDAERREDAKRRYDEAKSQRDTAQNYFAENDTEENQLAQNVQETQTVLAEKGLALEDARKSGDSAKIAAAKKEFGTAQQNAYRAQQKQNLFTTSAAANQSVETTSADLAQKELALQQAQFSGDPEMIAQAQGDYDEADYAMKQAEYKQALSEAQNSDYAVSEAEQNLQNVLKNGTPEEKQAAKEELKAAKAERKDAFARLSSFDTGAAVAAASPDYSNPESEQNRDDGEEGKSEIKNASSGTFDAFEALGSNYDWTRNNGEKQLSALTDIKSILEDRDGAYL